MNTREQVSEFRVGVALISRSKRATKHRRQRGLVWRAVDTDRLTIA